MTRKTLPKVIRRTDADLREAVAEPIAEVMPPVRKPKAAAHVPPLETELEPEILPPAANDLYPIATMQSQIEAEKRLRKGFAIVERHQMYSGLGGLFPVAAVNVASVTAINLRMVKMLSELYGMPFERDKTRSFVIGLMGGAAPAGLAAATATTLVHLIPAAAAVGVAVSSVASAALTRRIGLACLERFEVAAFEQM